MAADAVRKGVGAGETAGEWGIVRLCGQCGFGLGQRAADAGAEERGTRDGGAQRMGGVRGEGAGGARRERAALAAASAAKCRGKKCCRGIGVRLSRLLLIFN